MFCNQIDFTIIGVLLLQLRICTWCVANSKEAKCWATKQYGCQTKYLVCLCYHNFFLLFFLSPTSSSSENSYRKLGFGLAPNGTAFGCLETRHTQMAKIQFCIQSHYSLLLAEWRIMVSYSLRCCAGNGCYLLLSNVINDILHRIRWEHENVAVTAELCLESRSHGALFVWLCSSMASFVRYLLFVFIYAKYPNGVSKCVVSVSMRHHCFLVRPNQLYGRPTPCLTLLLHTGWYNVA